MGRKPNYDFEKRKKEQERKAKKEAKRVDRLQRREERQGDDTGDLAGLEPGTDQVDPAADQPDAGAPLDQDRSG